MDASGNRSPVRRRVTGREHGPRGRSVGDHRSGGVCRRSTGRVHPGCHEYDLLHEGSPRRCGNRWPEIQGLGREYLRRSPRRCPFPALRQASHRRFAARRQIRHDSAWRRATAGRFRLALSAEAVAWPVGFEAKNPTLPKEVLDREAAFFTGNVPLFRAQLERDLLRSNMAKVVVTESGKPEVTRILPRGNWMDETGPSWSRRSRNSWEASPSKAAPPGSISPTGSSPRQSADGPGLRQSRVAAVLRNRAIQGPGRLARKASGPRIPNCSTGWPRNFRATGTSRG